MKKIILIRGIPGSGKSTLAYDLKDFFILSSKYGNKRVELENKVEVYEADQYFEDENGNYNFNKHELKDAHKSCQRKTWEFFNFYNEGIVIVSNTFTTKKELIPYFEIAKEFNIIPQVILCEGNYKSIHNVPKETIERMKKRFEYDISDLFIKYDID